MDRRRASVLERVRDRDLGLDPLQPEALEGKPTPEGRQRADRVNSGADVVQESGKGQLSRPRPSADMLAASPD